MIIEKYIDKTKESMIVWLLEKIMNRRSYGYTLSDGTKVMRMSAKFCNWTYNKNYTDWEKEKTGQSNKGGERYVYLGLMLIRLAG